LLYGFGEAVNDVKSLRWDVHRSSLRKRTDCADTHTPQLAAVLLVLELDQAESGTRRGKVTLQLLPCI